MLVEKGASSENILFTFLRPFRHLTCGRVWGDTGNTRNFLHRCKKSCGSRVEVSLTKNDEELCGMIGKEWPFSDTSVCLHDHGSFVRNIFGKP